MDKIKSITTGYKEKQRSAVSLEDKEKLTES